MRSVAAVLYFRVQYNYQFTQLTGFTPYEFMFGRRAKLPTSTYERRDQELNYETYAGEMRKCFAKMHAPARENLIL